MQTVYATMSSKGQITLPIAIRHALGLGKGDKVAFSIEEASSGQVILRPVGPVVDALFGSVEARQRPENFAALRSDFETALAEEVVKELS
jgi:AbrB family looped-hinge helix DNA binding protein